MAMSVLDKNDTAKHNYMAMKCKKKNSNIQSKKMKTKQPLNANHSATQDKNEERKHSEDR